MSNTPQEPPIEPGMVVTSTETGLDEHDISQAKVKGMTTDAAGKVTEITIEKGLLLKKDVVVPADRITEVDAATATEPGAVKIATSEAEIDALSAVGTETLPVAEPAAPPPAPTDVLSKAQEELPTADGMKAKEGRNDLGAPASPAPPHATNRFKQFFNTLGPGFLAGMAGNDASAVTSYSVNGATNGYGQLWLMLLSTPMFQAVQYACGKVGRVTKKGLAEVLREQYGTRIAVGASVLLIIANIGLVAGDLVAIGSGFELITGIPWLWFVVPAALFLWYVTVFRNFATIKKIFLVMSLAFIAYLVTGIAAHPNWGQVLQHTFVPSLGFDFISISSAVALLGATVSPYTMFWQVQAEQEETRIGSLRQQLKSTRLDIANGVISGNLVAYFIIVCTSATLFVHHQQIATAADAARALQPLVGPFAKYLFAIGLIGAGLVAIPVLLASTAYAVSGTFGWTASLWKKPWQTEGFYLTLTMALVISLVVALLRINPIQIMFWANVLQGLLAPVLVILVILVANNRRLMGKEAVGKLTNGTLFVTAGVMILAAVFFFVGLFSGKGG